ncbi:AraC family transcriptional regulator [Paracoccus sp. KR1-242]|uniref:AraC family transcriptional regulator n=1 Tax=Paracoccus sp. KR1-242 TaxID=3410028 RepID=UPI003C0E9118
MYELPSAWIMHAAEQLGASSTAIRGALQSARLHPQFLSDDNERVSDRKCVDFLECAASLTGDDTLGLNLGKSYDVRRSGLAAYVSISAETLREGVLHGLRYVRLGDTSAEIGLKELGNVATIRIDSKNPYFRMHRQGPEFRMASWFMAARQMVSERFQAVEVRFAHPRASSREAFTRFFGCPVAFGAEATEMLIQPASLALPMRKADPHLLALLQRTGDALLSAQRAEKTALRLHIERLVLSALPKGGPPDIAQIAKAVALSERTLARKLQAEGTSYQGLVNEIRRDAAKSYLADRSFSIRQVAYLLGYSEQSGFTTAFRRWTNQTPRAYREARMQAFKV